MVQTNRGVYSVRPDGTGWKRTQIPTSTYGARSVRAAAEVETGGDHAYPRGIGQLKWSPDGRRLLIFDNHSIAYLNADGTGRRLIWRQPRAERDWWWIEGADWAFDGRRVTFTGGGEFGGYERAYTIGIDGQDLRALLPTDRGSPWTRGIDLYGLGPPVWAPDGASIVFRAWEPPQNLGQPIVMVRPDSTGFEIVGATPEDTLADHVDFSPDSQRLLFIDHRHRGDPTRTWIRTFSLETGRIKTLVSATRPKGLHFEPSFTDAVWSPTGSRIAYVTDRPRRPPAIYTVNSNGRGKRLVVTLPKNTWVIGPGLDWLTRQ